MFRRITEQVWVFDAEWVPDPQTGRAVYGLPASMTDEEVIREMWRQGGATQEEPMPFLKMVLCRVVALSVLIRRQKKEEVSFHLHSLPLNQEDGKDRQEISILAPFLDQAGQFKPQLVGYNSQGSDLKIILQRSLVHGLRAEAFVHRTGHRWDEPNYFNRDNDWNVDLMKILGDRGKATPTLHQIATACGIPGKIDADGEHIASLWLKGDITTILNYNQCDVLTTYLLWLRLALFAGFMETEEYQAEENQFREFVLQEARDPKRSHFSRYVEVWDQLQGRAPAESGGEMSETGQSV